MDVDLDFSDDKIESFLSAKLDEIRHRNESLETTLNQHKHAFKTSSGATEINYTHLEFTETDSWKRIFNNKYAIGCVFLINGKKNELKDMRILITWNAEEILSYKVETFSVIPASKEHCTATKNCNLVTNTIRHCDTFQEKAYVIITFDVPQFLYKLQYEIYGTIVCNIDGQNFNVSFPKVTISTNDSTTGVRTICWDGQNSLHNIFSIMACSDRTDLVMILPEEWTASLVSTFEIHCALLYLNMPISCKSYFFANNVSKLFDNTLISVHSHHDNSHTLFLTVYASNNNQMYAFCHYLGECLPNMFFFPLLYYESYLCKNAVFSKELLEQFQKNMCKELKLSYKFAQDSSDSGSQQVNNFRCNLSTIESVTDKLFLKVSNMKY